ncbi:hypothetical protein IEE94_05010 [Yimella sp. cx-573]|nr:hypothetical protein [Yimella sp. cx-573]
MVGNRAMTALYWVIGFGLATLAGVAGAAWGNSQAPTFENEETGGTPATGASRLMFSIFGGLLGSLGVLAIFAAIYMVLWVRARRANPPVEEEHFEDDDTLLDEMEFGDDEEVAETPRP